MKLGRSLRWPNLTEQLLVQLLVAVVAATVGFLWHRSFSWSDRALIVIGAVVLVLPLIVLYEKFRSDAMIVIPTVQEYEKVLTRLASEHSGTISWVTKTSIWADVPEAYSGRLAAKIAAIQGGRISRMRYVIHLGYWRQYALDDLANGSYRTLEIYRVKIQTLLRHVQDYSICPPECVQIVVGEIEDIGPPHRFGLYTKKNNREVLVFGYDAPMGTETVPRLLLKGHNDLTQYFEDLFDQQWRRYVGRAVSKAGFPVAASFPNSLRRSLINSLNSELEWIYSTSGDQEAEEPQAIPTDQAKSLLDKGATVTLSCPQKVCVSGDYGDMHDGGASLTASINIRPYLTIKKGSNTGKSYVTIAGKQVRDDHADWPLIKAFKVQADSLPEPYTIQVFPTALTNIGLGSSGAASVLLTAAATILEGQPISDKELIRAAHQFETNLASWPCGPQDHVASVLGGLNLIEYPSLRSRKIAYASIWGMLTFWMLDDRRNAHEVIPLTMQSHTSAVWARKHDLTWNISDALAAGDLGAIIKTMREEAVIQKQLNMLTSFQLEAIKAVERIGGGAKVSGAGGGGVIVAFAPDRERLPGIRLSLQDLNYTEVQLSVDAQGITVEAAGKPLR